MVEEENNISEEERKKLELIENFLQKVVFTKQLNDRDNINNEMNTLENDLNTNLKLYLSEKNNELIKKIIQKLTNPKDIDNEVFERINEINKDSYEYRLLEKLTFYADEIEAHNQYSLKFLLKISKTYKEVNYTIATFSLYPQFFTLFYNDIAVSTDKDKIEILKSMLKFLKRIKEELISI